MVDFMKLAARPNRPQLAAARHSENSATFPGRQEGPVKGMAFDSASEKCHLSVGPVEKPRLDTSDRPELLVSQVMV